jgi:Tfp pilus assembly protein PilO
MGDPFNIFIGQMGYWMPFNPPTDSIENQEYAIEELNTLMKNYKDKQIQQEDDYETRKGQLREIVEVKEKAPEPEVSEEVAELVKEITEPQT